MVIDTNYEKVIFVNLTEMQKYQGKEPVNPGGGSYVEDHGYGHELFNFLDDDGYCYGYSPPYGKINIKRISPSTIQNDKYGEYIDNILVVFTGSRKGKGRLVIGFYKNAKVYSELVDDGRKPRYLHDANKYIQYNIKCKATDTFLIDYDKRSRRIPQASKKTNTSGYGQSAVWYASEENDQQIKKEIIEYLNSYISNVYQDDEEKYGNYWEGETSEQKATRRKRSRKAKEECLRLNGYSCKICGFNFEEEYGELGKLYIEVHHLKSMKQISEDKDYVGTDPREDLIPICSNCHSMIHRKEPHHSPEFVQQARRNKKNE